MITLHDFLDLYNQITDALISTVVILVAIKNHKGNDLSKKTVYNKLKNSHICTFRNISYESTF